MSPGVTFASSVAELREGLASALAPSLFLPAGTRFELGGEQLVISGGTNATLASEGEGATLDAQRLSRVITVRGASRLVLVRIHLVNGDAGDAGAGGGIMVREVSFLYLENATITNCSASWGGGMDVYSSVAMLQHATFIHCAAQEVRRRV